MKTINLIIMMLSTTLWVSCKGPKIKPQINADINLKFNRCRVRCFDLMNAKTTDDKKCNIYPKHIPTESPKEFYSIEVRDSDGFVFLQFNSGDYALEVCDKITGVYLDDYAKKIKPWAKKTIQYYKDAKR